MKTKGITSTGRPRSGAALAALVVIAGSLVFHPAVSFAGDGPFTVYVRGNLTTSSLLYTHPDSPDPITRGESVEFAGFFGTGAELRYRLPESNVAIGLSADYIRARSLGKIQAFPGTVIPVEDGYTVVPVEVTGYFIIPFSSETFGVYMGGGGGIYFGQRTHRLGTTDAALVKSAPGAGIHVLGGITYRFYGAFEAAFEMKFRDVQFKNTNAFTESRIRYESVFVNVDQQPFTSRTQTDGIVFQIGIGFSF